MNANPGAPLSDELVSQQLYWLNRLSGPLPYTVALADSPVRRMQPSPAGRFELTMPDDVCERILKLAKSSYLSVYLILVSAFTVLLGRYVGEDDLIIGSPAYDPAAGDLPAGNLVPLRLRVNQAETFRMYLVGVKRVVLEAYSNASCSVDELVELLAIEHVPDRSPLFDIIVSLRNIHGECRADGMKNNMTVEFGAGAKGISANITYNSSIDRTDVSRMAECLTNVLSSVLKNPDIKLGQVRLLSPEDEDQLVFRFNETDLSFSERSVPELFDDQVRRGPDRIAAVAGDQVISYAELDARANRFARQLHRIGVSQETLVALLARRSIEYLAAMMAVFKAGGAYLPLDPSHPPRRLEQIMRESRSRLLLGEAELLPVIDAVLEAIPANDRPAVALLGELFQELAPAQDMGSGWESNSLSYVIYTSGSTGSPKGAMIEHAGLRNHLCAKVHDLQMSESDAVAQNAPQCFDVSVWQFLSVLLVGGRVLIANDETAIDTSELLAMLERERVTILEIVPSQMRAMLDLASSGRAPDLSSVRWLIVNGEVLPPQVCRRWFELYPRGSLINAYGHTECSDDESHYALHEAPPEEAESIPIGSPLPNLRLYLVDRTLSPVPPGIPGEVYVGGIGVGRGYLGEPARTAGAYLPDPFATQCGARLYKTGDLARHLSCGNLDFVNRADYQVKIRGFRIELGEIESALRGHPAIGECVVVAREDEPNQARIVAYVVPKHGLDPTTTELHSFVQERLPDYMIPSAFVRLEGMPLNRNGKVDRRALAEPDGSRPELSESFVAPRTAVEAEMAGIWAKLLGLNRIGVHDNFFQLGGHSLLAIQLVSRVREAFEVELPLRSLFEAPSVEGLSLAVTQMQLDQMSEDEVARMIEELT